MHDPEPGIQRPGRHVGARRDARVDPTIDFTFPNAPDPALGADSFSVRWLGQLQAPVSGAYSFRLKFNDGVRFRHPARANT